MITENPTKAEELAHWRQFLADLPPCSYLALYLKGSDGLLEHYMAQDMSCTAATSAVRSKIRSRHCVKSSPPCTTAMVASRFRASMRVSGDGANASVTT